MRSRKIIRLKGYDYSNDGWYFVTVVTQDRLYIFGNVIEKKMILNDAGIMIKKWYYLLENKFKHIKCHECIIMPNHIHFIIQIFPNSKFNANVGADPRVRPEQYECHSLSRIMQWFKTMTTNEYIKGVKKKGWRNFHRKLWERSFIDRILREHEIERTINYIKNNPLNWKKYHRTDT
jgi:REP element-mobilizing transposase RayT